MRAAGWLIMMAGFSSAPLALAQSSAVPLPVAPAAPGATLGAVTGALPAGDATRGAAIVANRAAGLCVLCHAVPGVPASQQGSLAPPLAGAGARWSADQLRERLVAPERFNPDTLMPSFRRSSGFTRVAPARQGQALFDAQQLEDVVAYLATLR